MKRHHIKKNDEAVVGIITVVLVISLIVIVIGIVKTVYFPEWIKSAEFQHMNQVSNQFAQLKYALDIQAITNGSCVVNSLVTLGTAEIPILGVHESFDELSILPDSCTLVIQNKYGLLASYTTDSIKFAAHNTNYIDQSFIYEGGTLILSQADRNVMVARPSMLVTQYGKNITISFINVSLGAGATHFAGGRGTYPIYTQILKNSQQYDVIHNVTTLTVQTTYPAAWYEAFNASLLYAGISYSISTSTNSVTLSLLDPYENYFNVLIREVKISADLAFGVVQ